MSAQASKGGGGTPVFVNIYDMYTMNNYTSAIGVGIYHCGIEVYGVEYGYGGHPFPFSGVFEMTPKDTEELGETFRFKEVIEIGRTDFTKQEIDQIITMMGRDFKGADYHLINRNCNHFSSRFSKTLCGEDIPSWVNRLAYMTTFVPFVEKMIPKEWISPIAVQNSVAEHQAHEKEQTNHQNTSNTTNNTSNSTSNNNINSSSNSSSSKTNGNSASTANLIINNNNDNESSSTSNGGSGGGGLWNSILSNLDCLEQGQNIRKQRAEFSK